MSCTIASSDEPSVMTWVARSRWRSTPRISASLGRLPEAGYLASSAATSQPVAGDGGPVVGLERCRDRLECRADVAEHRHVAGIVEPELAGRGRDLDDLQLAGQRRAAIVGEGIDLLADQQHRLVAARESD